MDLETFILKASQLNNNIYCLKNKPLLAIGYDFKGLCRSTLYNLSTCLFVPQERDTISGNLRIKTFSDNYPAISAEIVPFKFHSLKIKDDNFKINLNSTEYSLFFNFNQNNSLKCSLLYNIKSPKSITASFDTNDFYYSTRITEKSMSIFGGFSINQNGMFLSGVKFVNNSNFFDNLNHVYLFSKLKMINNYFTYAVSMSNDIKFAISKCNDHRRFTFSWRKEYNFDRGGVINTDFIYEYKRITKNGNKFAFGFNLSEPSLFTRTSLKIGVLKYKTSIKFDFENGFQPSLGFFFTNKIYQ